VWAVVRYYVHWPGNMRSAAETVAVLEAAEQAGQIRRYGVRD
jgi:diketogulonate reductase-like aldo/keto reductase